MREWLPGDHPVWVVLGAVEQFDLTAFENAYRADGRSRPPYDPKMMVALLLWAYAHGLRSSRAIETACRDSVPFRVIVGGLRVDHVTICRFRSGHEQALADLHVQVLGLLGRAGMVRLGRVSLDGTKISADASWSANRTADQLADQITALEESLREQVEAMLAQAGAADAADDALWGAGRREEELPAPLRRQGERLARLVEAKRQLDADTAVARAAQDAKIEAWEQRKAAGEPTGRHPNPDPRPTTRNGKPPRRNTTDPDARVMKTKHTLLVGYNAQAVVTDDQIIVGADLTQDPVDAALLPAMLDTTIAQATAAGLNPTPTTGDAEPATRNPDPDPDDDDDHDASAGAGMDVVLADAGYAGEKAYQAGDDKQLRLIAPRRKNIDPRTQDPSLDPINPDKYPATERARQRLASPQGQTHYRQRGRTVEPVFGQIKTIQNLTRFARRGLAAARSEWLFSCAVHNLRKYLNHPAALTA